MSGQDEASLPASEAIRTAGHTLSGATTAAVRVPRPKMLRDRLRAIASDMAAAWRSGPLPEELTSTDGLRKAAEQVVTRGGGRSEHVGWTMVALVTAYWRDRLVESGGKKLLLLPDCRHAAVRDVGAGPDVHGLRTCGPDVHGLRTCGPDVHGLRTCGPDVHGLRTCGPQCVFGTLAAAAVDSGWQVSSTRDAAAAIAGMLGGVYDGVLGVASLDELERAYDLVPPFAMPIAAVPVMDVAEDGLADESASGGAAAAHSRSCPAEQVDAEWVLSLLGVAGGAVSPVADHLPLLRESAELFSSESLTPLLARLGVDAPVAQGPTASPPSAIVATEWLSMDFLTRGGKFLRPFMALAAFDAVKADVAAGAATRLYAGGCRTTARAAAVAIEVFHKASLVHDDIEDDDGMRYGRPTVHRQHGVPSAINAGDYLVGLGYRIIGGLGRLDRATAADPSLERDLLVTLSEAHLRLARGQGAELWWRDASDKRLTPAEALEIYGLKTSPAFEAALVMGVRLAGCDPLQAGDLAGYALHVGTAFQVLNDLKDWHGDLENLRQAAGDLLGGRPTVLWATAMERLAAGDAQRLLLLSAAAGGHQPGDDAARLREARMLYERADVFARAREIVREHRTLATQAAASCRIGRLRDVLEFLLDLAVPEVSA